MAINREHKFAKLILPLQRRLLLMHVALHCKQSAKMPLGPKHELKIRNAWSDFTFSHEFLDRVTLLIKINEVQYLSLWVQVLQETLS